MSNFEKNNQRTKNPSRSNAEQVASLKSNENQASLSPPPFQLKSVEEEGGQLQLKADSKNETGMPDNLKAGIENLSGMDMSDVNVHYNSSQPAQFNAHAYAQGSDIHLGGGQEKHLPHEAWHVAQQKQGRVKPTTSMGGAAINDDAALENEADVMGNKALSQMSRDKDL